MKLTISYDDYCDRILGGWLGKSIGGTIGAPVENLKRRMDFTADTLWPDKIQPNDDLDIQVVWLEALEERGVWLDHKDLVDYWQDRCWYNFCEYGFFLYNVQRGIMPPLSGRWNNRFFSESEGCPIRSEIWGMVCPGAPELAAEYAQRDGELDHRDTSVWCEMFLAGAAAAAFFESDIPRVLQAGLDTTPPDNPVRDMVAEVTALCASYPNWEDAWRMIVRRYGDRDASKAIMNQAIVVMALLMGGGDFTRTMLLTCNSGWDTDCTAATAGALLGIINGSSALPEEWVTRMGTSLACGVEVRHKTASFSEMVEDTARVGIEMSLARNKRVKIANAPSVTVRPRPTPCMVIDIKYPATPVLWRERSTPIRLIFENPQEKTIRGEWEIALPEYMDCATPQGALSLTPGERIELVTQVWQSGDVVWDSNRMALHWSGEDGSSTQHAFGLGGARQWTLYGPYWETWDATKDDADPYMTPSGLKGPNFVPGHSSDGHNHYARLDQPYLNEARLLREHIPEELPELIELGEDFVDGKELAGFRGQACFYLVRQLVAAESTNVSFYFGSNAPSVIWFDGAEIFRREVPLEVAPHDCSIGSFEIDSTPKRLVLKLARQTDDMGFCLCPVTKTTQHKRGISMIMDGLGDVPGDIA